MEASENLKAKFPGLLKEVQAEGYNDVVLELSDKNRLIDVVSEIKRNFEALYMLMVVDRLQSFELNYVFFTYSSNALLTIRLDIEHENPRVDSLARIFESANWEEREAYDLFGVMFNDHPDLRRIMLPDDWPGHPMRKDFLVTDEIRRWTGLDLKF